MQRTGSAGQLRARTSNENLYQQPPSSSSVRFNSLSSVSANASIAKVFQGLVCLGYTVIGREGLLLIARTARSQFALPNGQPLIVIKVGGGGKVYRGGQPIKDLARCCEENRSFFFLKKKRRRKKLYESRKQAGFNSRFIAPCQRGRRRMKSKTSPD